MNSKRKTIVGAILLMALFQAACNQSQVITALESAVSAAEVAVPVIAAATGLAPATSAQIVTYLQAVSTATGQAAIILSGTGTAAQKAALIVAAFAKVASGLNLPAGTPQEVVAVVNAVAQAVVNFLANFQAAPTPALKKPLKLSAASVSKLSDLKKRSDTNLEKLKGVKR